MTHGVTYNKKKKSYIHTYQKFKSDPKRSLKITCSLNDLRNSAQNAIAGAALTFYDSSLSFSSVYVCATCCYT